MHPFLQKQTVHSSFAIMPQWTDDMVIAHWGQLSIPDIKELESLLYPSKDFIYPVVPISMKDLNIGEQIEKMKGNYMIQSHCLLRIHIWKLNCFLTFSHMEKGLGEKNPVPSH